MNPVASVTPAEEAQTMTTPVGNLPSVTNKGRPSDYTAEEDAIILRYHSTDEVREKLREAGFRDRTPPAIWSRRRHLRVGGGTELDSTAIPEKDEMTRLIERQKKLRDQLGMLRYRTHEVEAELAEVTERLHALVERAGATDSEP